MTAVPAPAPRPDDMLSLAERTWALAAVRALAYAAVLASLVLAPAGVRVPPIAVVTATAGSAIVTAVTLLVGRLSLRRAVLVMGASLLADGVYLGWVIYVSGGGASPMWFLLYAHVLAATLLASSATGLKVVVWHTLVRLAVLYAEASGALALVDPARVVPRAGAPVPWTGLTGIGVTWVIFVVAALAAGVNERELRAHRLRLEALSAMVRRFEASPVTDDIAVALVETLRPVFGVRRAAVLVAHGDELALVAGSELEDVDAVPHGPDDAVERAWERRKPILVRRLDPDGDRRIAALMPGATNVVVLPLPEQRGRVGVVALERGGRASGLRRSTVAMLEQFCTHAWLAMSNGWLLDDIRDALEENRALHDRLLEQNRSLEQTVEERTAEVTERLRQLRTVDDARRALLDKLVTAQEEERSRLAGDIHDDPIQKMVVASMRLQMLRRQVGDPDLTDDLEELLASIRTSIASLRHLIFELRPTVLDEEGLAAALRSLLDSLAGEMSYDLENDLLEEPSPDMRVILYRIAQEAIGNVRKHARTDHVEVRIGTRRGGYFVRVKDHGVGFGATDVGASAPGHLGLTSMRERAELAGGSCVVQSLPGSGTVVEAWVPGPEAAAAEPDAVASLGRYPLGDEERRYA